LVPIHEHKKWTEGAAFLKFWIAGPSCVARTDPKTNNKATIGVNLTNPCMRIYTLTWDWLLKGTGDGFTQAQKGFRDVQDPKKLFSKAARGQIAKAYGGTPGQFGEWLQDGLAHKDFFSKIKDHQLQYSDAIDATGLTDIGATLANFFYYVFYKGETIPSAQFRSRLGDLRGSFSMVRWLIHLNINLSYPQDPDEAKSRAKLEENLKKLEATVQAIIIVKAVGIYLGDIFEFGGKQYLGTWDLTKLDVQGSKWDGAWYSEPGPVEPDAKGKIVVGNETFRRYRSETNQGGDFFVFTPVKLVPVQDSKSSRLANDDGVGEPVILVYK
jgi:hypothetical protein